MVEKSKFGRVCVVVLGDLGRSPRMEYHSLSLAESGYTVDIVAYGGSQPIKKLLENERVHIHFMKEFPSYFANYLPRVLSYGSKLIWQFITLFWTLHSVSKPTHILVQAPPSVPALGVVWCYSLFCTVNVVVDWHNYGYTILQLSVGTDHFLARFYKWFELFFGKKASKHLCVTKALAADLRENAGIVATTLYDRPPEQFHSYSIDVIHELLRRLSSTYDCFADRSIAKTAFTEMSEHTISLRNDRPALIISSTSWTEDEDMSILISALEEYDKIKSFGVEKLPDLICAITGKGPLKEFYTNDILSRNFRHIKFCFPWLTAEDYPVLLAAADIGISLHSSSSGLDLPMKVVDMFGCGLPVLALHFACLEELVQQNENGYIFKNPCTLSRQLQSLLENFPNKRELERMKKNLQPFQQNRWESNWNTHARPLFVSQNVH